MLVPAPMLATPGKPPADTYAWATEMKWDGMRALCRVAHGECRIYSRTLRPVTDSFPELAVALTRLSDNRSLIVDAEIIAPEPATGAPSFARLQQRMHVAKPPPTLIRAVPAQLFAFDLLELDGRPVTSLPYVERRALLADLDLSDNLVRTPPHWIGINPAELLSVAQQHGLEGTVSKRVDSAYHPGRRSRAWIKTPLRRATDVLIAGYIPASGGLGSLVLGAHTGDGQLIYIGHVGTGFTAAARRTLRTQLDAIRRLDHPFDQPPPRARGTIRWVTPTLVGAVEYREYVEALRHPSWRGLRNDVEAHTVRLPL